MKTLRNVTIAVSIGVIGFMAGGCADSVSADNNENIYSFSEDGNIGNMSSLTMVDSETGVNYIVIKYWDKRGEGVTTAITPRLTSEGFIYTEK